jgi:hypothetical protein
MAIGVHAQIMLKGKIVDSTFKNSLSAVSIENMTTHKGTYSNSNGEFVLEAREGDYIYCTFVGYKSTSYRVYGGDANRTVNIIMAIKPVQLKDVTILRGMTKYQKDSANRASLYQDAFEYNQQKSAMTPITSVYQKFSKKYKNLRKFQSQIVNNEQQKFIDTRYSKELVSDMTKLPIDSVNTFMNLYPMPYDYARVASDLEIKMWIKYNYQDYLSKTKQ